MEREKKYVLNVENLHKSYCKGKIKANNHMNIMVESGQIVALIGHNGAGKTTLLNQICGNAHPDKGRIIFNGVSLVENPKYAREIVSIMPQFHAPLVGVTLSQAIRSILCVKGVSGNDAKERLEMVIKALDIEAWKKTAGEQLSGGLQRLTSFAMTVAAPTPILLFDEPTNDVDPIRRGKIWEYMRRLANDNHLVVVVTHNLLEVEHYADRYILLDKGCVVADTIIKERKLENSRMKFVLDIEEHVDMNPYPKVLDLNWNNTTHQLILTVSHEQIMETMEWVLKEVDLGRIQRYTLEKETLESIYGGLINV